MILITVLHFLISSKKKTGGVRRESVGVTFGYHVLNQTKTITTSDPLRLKNEIEIEV